MKRRPGQTQPLAKEEEMDENIWLAEEKKKKWRKKRERKEGKHLACREGKGGNYWERENIWSEEEKKNEEGKEGKYLGEGK